MSFSINPEYYNAPRMSNPVKIIQEEKVDDNGVTYIEERIVPDVKIGSNKYQGDKIASVPFIAGSSFDYQ